MKISKTLESMIFCSDEKTKHELEFGAFSSKNEIERPAENSALHGAVNRDSANLEEQSGMPQLYAYENDGVPRGASASLDPSRLAVMSQFTQRFIYRWQHPEDCSAREVIFSQVHNSGFGSVLHVVGSQLAWAISNNKVLSWNPGSCTNFVDPSVCHGMMAGCGCYFQALTNCSHSGLPSKTTPVIGGSAPDVLVKMLRKIVPAMKEDEIKYWWRGQSVAYLMRLNLKTHMKVLQLRMDDSIQKAWGQFKKVPFPLPRGVISMHVRHGDKGKEMNLVDTKKYLQAAAKMVRQGPNQYHSRSIVVTCDDERDIYSARNSLKKMGSGWSMFHSVVARHDHGFDLGKMRRVQSKWNVTTAHISQLFLALEADGFIGTRASNWNRLIDELRCIWVDKCTSAYVEVGTEGRFHW